MRERLGAALGVTAYLTGLVATIHLLLAVGTGGGIPRSELLVPLAAVAGFVAATRYRRVRAVRRPRVSGALAAPVLVSATAVIGVGLLDGSIFAPGVLAALLAGFGVSLLRGTAATLHARRRTADVLFLAELPAAGRTLPRWLRGLAAALALVSLGAAGVALLAGRSAWTILALLALGPLSVALSAPRAVWITEAGVLLESRFSARLLEWEDLEGYYLGTNLVLFRVGWWRRDLVFDADAVSDPARAALDDFLPRSEARAVPAGGPEGSVSERSEPTGT